MRPLNHLYLQSFVNISEDANLEIETTWKLALNDSWTVVVSTDSWLSLGPFECEGPLFGYLAEICIHNGRPQCIESRVSFQMAMKSSHIHGPYSTPFGTLPSLNLSLSLNRHPPNQSGTRGKEGDGNSSVSGDSPMPWIPEVIIGLGAIVVVLAIIVLITGRKQAPPPPMRPPPTGIPQMVGQNFRR